MKKIALALAGLTLLAPSMASAQYGHQRYDNRYEFRGYDRAGNPVYTYHDQRYNRYNQDHRYDAYNRDRYRDRRCNDGETGTIVGAIAGGLLGRTIDTRGDRTTGTLLGGAGGALAGRAIERTCR